MIKAIKMECMNINAVPVLRTMTFTELMGELRVRGFSIGNDGLKEMIASGALPFAQAIKLKKTKYIIFKKGFDKWVTEHSVMETPTGFQDAPKTDASI